MAEWVKLATSAFANKKIKLIRAMENGDSMALLWFNLICLAGETNDNGYIYVTSDVPYTSELLASICGYDENVVEQALNIFQKLHMIDIEDNGYIYIIGWEEHQNAEELAKIKERERVKKAMRAKREREKQNVTCNTDVTNADVTSNKVKKCSNVTCNTDVTNADVTVQNKNKNKSKNNNYYYPNNVDNASNVVVVDDAYKSSTSNITKDDNPVGFWNRNITPITPYIAERIAAVIAEFGEMIAMQAVTITAQQGKKSIAYFEGVARNLAAGDTGKPKKPPDEFKPPDDQTDLDNLF